MSDYTGGGHTVSIELVTYQHSPAQIAVSMDFMLDITTEKDVVTAFFYPGAIRQMAAELLRLANEAEGKAE